MKCKNCNYCVYMGKGISGGYKCTHKKIHESAERYKEVKRTKINKAVDHIGYNMIKTSLRYCPLKGSER